MVIPCMGDLAHLAGQPFWLRRLGNLATHQAPVTTGFQAIGEQLQGLAVVV